MDLHSPECLAVEGPEVRSVAGHKHLAAELYRALIAEMRSRGLHCAIAGISLPNPASIALHEKLGFRPIGQFREVGWKFGKWVDVGYWEVLL